MLTFTHSNRISAFGRYGPDIPSCIVSNTMAVGRPTGLDGIPLNVELAHSSGGYVDDLEPADPPL
jgi:hypothetical protein